MVRAARTMKVTTVRFGADLWELLDAEAARGKATEQRDDAKALRAQSEQAARQARAVTARSQQAIARTKARDVKARNQD